MFDCKSKFDKLEFHAFDIATEGCKPCQARAEDWIWVGCMLLPSGQQYKLDETYKPQWKKVRFTDEGAIIDTPNAQVSTLKAMPDLIGIELPKHIRSAPLWLPELTNLRRLNLNHCAFLAEIPVSTISKLEHLEKVECAGNERLLPAKFRTR